MLEGMTTRTVDSGGKLTVKSALNPLLWFCAVVDFPIIVILAFIHSSIPTWLLIGFFTLICTPIATLVFSAIFLLFVDRDKLQSEDYQIRKRTLDMMGQKGDTANALIKESNSIENPLFEAPRVISARNKKQRI